MLVFQKEGFLEVEDSQVEELYRSRTPISLEVPGIAPLPLHASLCRHLAASSSVCQVAFYCRTLKRAFVFSTEQKPVAAAMKSALQLLQSLGFSLEQVNLSLSPALRQVVLRDIAGLMTPAVASRLRSGKEAMLADLEATLCTENADSDAAKRAAHKLNVERQQDNKATLLRKALEDRLKQVEEPSLDLPGLVERTAELNARLEQALAVAAEERRHREHADAIRIAAERRLQELEADLVAAETRVSEDLKHKTNISQLKKRNKELQAQLAASAAASAAAQAGEAALAAANRQISRLEKNAKELQAQLAASAAASAVAQAGEAALAAANRQISQLEKNAKELQAQLAASAAAQAGEAALTAANRQLQEEVSQLRSELHRSASSIVTLEQALAAAGKTAAAAPLAESGESLTLRDRCQALEQELAGVTAELTEERDIHARLLKLMAADQKSISELEASLDDVRKRLAGQQAGDKDAIPSAERDRLEEALAAAEAAAQRELQVRETVEKELGEAHALIDDLEQAVKKLQTGELAARAPAAKLPDDRQAGEKTSGRLREIEVQLERERLEGRKLADALASAEKKLVALEAQLHEDRSHPARKTAPARADAAAGRKPLPHETRPKPSPGALFHPEWDLTGLPCQSPDQVLEAWGSVYNVQIALEGYTTQYCTAFVVVLREGSQKRLYVLFNLKKDKHILVCVPGKSPRDDAALKKLVNDVRNYLKRSGFELDKLKPADIPSHLAGYFSAPSP